jgi:hypothetical protein
VKFLLLESLAVSQLRLFEQQFANDLSGYAIRDLLCDDFNAGTLESR